MHRPCSPREIHGPRAEARQTLEEEPRISDSYRQRTLLQGEDVTPNLGPLTAWDDGEKMLKYMPALVSICPVGQGDTQTENIEGSSAIVSLGVAIGFCRGIILFLG